jgi:hypothetical protein
MDRVAARSAPILNDRPDNISATASQQQCRDLLSVGRASHAESRKRSARVACSKVARCHQALPTSPFEWMVQKGGRTL